MSYSREKLRELGLCCTLPACHYFKWALASDLTQLTLILSISTPTTMTTHTCPHRHTHIHCRASPPYCPVKSLFSPTHALSELNLCVIITWGVDEVAPWLILLDKIVQSGGSEMEGGRNVCEGTILTCQNNCLVFLCVDLQPPVVLHTLMILCLLSLSFSCHDDFYWLCISHWPRGLFLWPLAFPPMTLLN